MFMSKEQLYQVLSERYKLARERTDALSNRAHALLGFAGIINTILVAIILEAVDESKRVVFCQSAISSMGCHFWIHILRVIHNLFTIGI
jgi:hypothetical protein